jgi:[histone H3]-lysine79 N-trimethyltransferase
MKARNNEDGPAFMAALEEINKAIRALKNDPERGNILSAVPRAWSRDGANIPEGVVHRIVEETYQRCVGPNIDKLREYKAFSSNVYGELTPAFVSSIIALTGLHSDCLFMDLGSGVGNVVLQAALETGCRAYGIEQREDTAALAEEQCTQVHLRARMWGVAMGDVELEKEDMLKSRRLDELMGQADVVLVNNYVFSEQRESSASPPSRLNLTPTPFVSRAVNASLRPKFLDLKEGAIVISLKPYARPTSASVLLTERNFDDIAAIFDVTAHRYREGTVSWSGGGGMFYSHQVNRMGYAQSREEFEGRRMNRRRRGAAEEE